MAGLVLEQAVYRGPRPGQYKLLGLSPGFQEAFQSEPLRLCDGFGERPAGVACPGVCSRNRWGRSTSRSYRSRTSRTASWGFTSWSSRVAYRGLGGDPFFSPVGSRRPGTKQDRCPLDWSDEAIPARAMEHVCRILQRDDGPNLLGGSQGRWTAAGSCSSACSGDGFAPRPWALLPTSTRSELWPASFAFGNALGFHTLVTPRAEGPEFEGYLTDEQAGDYPKAATSWPCSLPPRRATSRELERLFARRSRAETFRLGVMILAASVLLLFILALIKPPARRAATPRKSLPRERRLHERQSCGTSPRRADAVFHEAGVFQGFSPRVEHYLPLLLVLEHMTYRPRSEVETDPSFKQIIPYVVLRYQDQLFHYARKRDRDTVAAAAFHRRGGHINADDSTLPDTPYREAMFREVAEEVKLDTTYTERCIGLINDDSNAVGQCISESFTCSSWRSRKWNAASRR